VALVDPLYNGDRFGEALEAGERASELAREVGEDRLLAEAEVRRGLALQGTGRMDDAREALEKALQLAERTGDLESLAKALAFQGDIALAQGQPYQARVYYERALKVDENRGDPAETAYLLGRLGEAFSVLGDWAQARSHLERAVGLVQSISFAYFSAASLVNLGEHYLLIGERNKASRYLEEPFTIAERSGQDGQIPYLHIPLAEWDLFEGRPEAALERLEALIRAPRFRSPSDHRAMQAAAAAYLETGDESLAEALLQEGLQHATRQGNALALLGWQHIEGILAARRGSWNEARQILDRAASLARNMPYPFAEARILDTYGAMSLRHGELGEARDRLAASLELFRQIGARPYAERAEQALTRVAM
jgi:tetratricopeptide (TPR) repeat protein